MRRLLLALLGVAAAAPIARADIALLANGMTLKVDSHRAQDATVFLTLHGGGEIGTPAEQVAGFVPDGPIPVTWITTSSSFANAKCAVFGGSVQVDP